MFKEGFIVSSPRDLSRVLNSDYSAHYNALSVCLGLCEFSGSCVNYRVLIPVSGIHKGVTVIHVTHL